MSEKIATLIQLFVSIFCVAGNIPADYPYDAVCAVTKGHSGGSGILIANSADTGLVITNKHVAGHSGTVQLRWANFQSTGRVLTAADKYDLTVIQTDHLPPIQPVQLHAFAADDGPFIAAGFPSYSRSQLQIQSGRFLERFGKSVLLSCEHKPGMSGGAVFNRRGELCGVIWGHNPREQTGWSVPGEHVIEFTDRYRAEPALMRVCLRRRHGSPEPKCPGGICPKPHTTPKRPTQPYDPKTAPKFEFPPTTKPPQPNPKPPTPAPTPTPPATPVPTPPSTPPVIPPLTTPTPTPPAPKPTPTVDPNQLSIYKLTSQIAALEKQLTELREKTLIINHPRVEPAKPITNPPATPPTAQSPIYYELRRIK